MAFHIWANCPWALLPMRPAMTPAIGMTTREMTANSGEIQNIMINTPMIVNRALRSCCKVCSKVWETLSMSLVIRLMSSPWG